MPDQSQNLLQVRVVSPHEELFSGEVLSVSSINSVGPFDILPEHAKFVTLVEKQSVVLRLPDGQKKEYKFNLAIIHVKDNQVNVYTNPKEVGQELTSVV